MHLHRFFEAREQSGQGMVLVTVCETAGSTYSKAGNHMLIDEQGNFCGMLSGGCLENDLVERARSVLASGDAEIATYDLGGDDEFWGLGVGCDGTMRLLLQPLLAADDYEPFASMSRMMMGREPGGVAMVIHSDIATVRTGATLVVDRAGPRAFGMDEATAVAVADKVAGLARIRAMEVVTDAGSCELLFSRIAPSPALLVLGAGLDSEPLVRFATELGWSCTVADHRSAYLEGRSYGDHVVLHCCPAEQLGQRVDLAAFDMAIVMSHHLVSDRSYLRQLAEVPIGYVGLLGPPGRRDRILDELGEAETRLAGRLHGPAGMQLGGRGPAPIALEIIAEMQAYLSRRA